MPSLVSVSRRRPAADDVDDLAGAAQRLVVGHAVEALDHLGPGGAEADHRAAAGDVVEAGRGLQQGARRAGVDVEDAGADLDGLGLRGEVAHQRRGVEAVRLGDPDRVEARLLQPGHLVGGLAGVPGVDERHRELHGSCRWDATTVTESLSRWQGGSHGPRLRAAGRPGEDNHGHHHRRTRPAARRNELVGRRFLVAGIGAGFEGTIGIRVLGPKGKVLARTRRSPAVVASASGSSRRTCGSPTRRAPAPALTVQVFGDNPGLPDQGPSPGFDLREVEVIVFPKMQGWLIYRVESGDTLTGIVRKVKAFTKVTVKQIVAANPKIDDPDEIKVGQRLRIPIQA